jgi:EpsI family protein
MTTESLTHERQSDRLQLVAMCALVAALVFAYSDVGAALVRQWLSNDMYSYAFAVPVLCAYMAWHALRVSPPFQSTPDYAGGLLLLCVALTMLVVGHVGSVLVLSELSLVVAVVAVVLLFFGRGVVRRIWFALTCLLFMVPIWDAPIARMHWASQLMSAKLATGLLHAGDIPAFRTETFILMPHLTLEVARECSGINQLVAVLAVSLPAAYVRISGYRRQALLIGFALLIASLSNGVRIAMIGAWTYFGFSSGDIHGPGHVLQGLAVSFVGYGVILAGLAFLSKRAPAPEHDQFKLGSFLRSVSRPRRPILEFAVAALVVAAGTYAISFQPADVRLKDPLQRLPLNINGWTASLISPSASEFHIKGADEEIVRTYRNAAGDEARLYVGYFRRQEQGKELIADASLNLLNQAARVELGAPHAVALNRVVREHGGKQRETLFWFDLNGRIVASAYAAKAYSIQDAMFRRRTNGAVVAVSWDAPSGTAPRGQDARDTFVRAVIEALRQHIPS